MWKGGYVGGSEKWFQRVTEVLVLARETGSCRKSRKVSSIGSRSERAYPHGSSSLKQKEEMTKEDEAPGKERN